MGTFDGHQRGTPTWPLTRRPALISSGAGRCLFTTVDTVRGALTSLVALRHTREVPDLPAWSPADWSAAASCGTLVVALVAAVVALRQYKLSHAANREAARSSAEHARLAHESNISQSRAAEEQSRTAKELAIEESRPYVIAHLEPSRANPMIIDLVVRNLGKTAAHDVRIAIDPRPQRSVGDAGHPEPVWLPEVFETFVPGQEWRTLFDFGLQRADSALPDQHRATITARDSRGQQLPPLVTALDWGQFKGRMWTTIYTAHDAAKALKEIEKHVSKWREDPSGGLSVFVRSGDERDRRRRDERDERQRQHDELTQRLLPNDDDKPQT